VLRHVFSATDHTLVFKGGTCLNKVYMGFFRLSEDLDFSVPIAPNATRSERSRLAQPLKSIVNTISTNIQGVKIGAPLTGANNSTQYVGELLYRSALSADEGRIKIEIGLREELLDAVASMPAATLIRDPFSRKAALDPVNVRCLSLREALAEKGRAMFTRKDIAIRDFFDYWHAQKSSRTDTSSEQFVAMVAGKIAVSMTPFVPLTSERLAHLEHQIATDLRPVLTKQDFLAFRLADAVKQARDLETALKRSSG
jgi:predicted nucleotidyltransferase component of viral defense system